MSAEGALRILSPSQVSVCQPGCYREWAFKYIAKVEQPPNKYAEAGKDCAKLLEEYYKTGVRPHPTKLGNVVNHAIAHLPPASRHVRSEHPLFEVPFAGGVFGSRRKDREMKMDVYDPIRDNDFVIGQGWTTEEPLICDLKTTTHLKNAKTAETLKQDIQVALYCKGVMIDTGSPFVQCRWVYVTREERPSVRCVDFRMSALEVADLEQQWQDTVDRINRLYALQPAPEQVPPNLTACHKFRGCAYGMFGLNICPLTDEQKVISLMSNQVQDNKDEVEALLASTNFGAPAVGQNLAAPSPAAQAAFVPLVAFSPPVVERKEPTPADFPLPPINGQPMLEAHRAAFLKWAIENDKNPLEHLGWKPSADFIAAARVLAGLDAPPVVPPAPPAFVPPAFVPPVAAAAPVPQPVVVTPFPSAPPAINGLPSTLEPEPPAPSPRRRGRPAGSRNRTKEEEEADADSASAAGALNLQGATVLVMTAEAMEVWFARMGFPKPQGA